jgi:hypothetical protein
MSKCSESVRGGGMWPSFHQCSREGKVVREGKAYCKTHDPVLLQERMADREKKWRDEWE